jgi:3-dehydroquinate dehydratase-2
MSAKRILIVNGPNLNLLGKRETSVYGDKSFEEYFVDLKAKFPQFELDYFQSNIEGELIDTIQQSTHDGVVLNAGGYTHTSVAIRDAISAIKTPVVEVHISNITARESFRHESMISPVCVGCVFGFGLKSYDLALTYFNQK